MVVVRLWPFAGPGHLVDADLEDRIGTADHTETDVGESGVDDGESLCGCQQLLVVVPGGAAHGPGRRVTGHERVGHPFPGIADRVGNADIVGSEVADRGRAGFEEIAAAPEVAAPRRTDDIFACPGSVGIVLVEGVAADSLVIHRQPIGERVPRQPFTTFVGIEAIGPILRRQVPRPETILIHDVGEVVENQSLLVRQPVAVDDRTFPGHAKYRERLVQRVNRIGGTVGRVLIEDNAIVKDHFEDTGRDFLAHLIDFEDVEDLHKLTGNLNEHAAVLIHHGVPVVPNTIQEVQVIAECRQVLRHEQLVTQAVCNGAFRIVEHRHPGHSRRQALDADFDHVIGTHDRSRRRVKSYSVVLCKVPR